jgi:uncharacterized membrane protein YhaH (DUF805 family)
MNVVARLLHWSFMDVAHHLTLIAWLDGSGRTPILLMLPFWILSLWPGLAIVVKRLHDRDRSGWWVILFVYGPWLAGYVVQAFVQPRQDLHSLWIAYNVVQTGILMWAFVELGCLQGTRGPNRFGADPLVTEDLAEAFT